MKVRRVALDQQNNPVVLLVDEEESIALPIWIGQAEAMAIAMRLQGVTPPRPMTHDLLQAVLERLAATVTRIVVSDVRDQTYFAEIHLARNGTTLVIDSRPSDAIALALRVEAPIFVEDKVAAQAIALRKTADGEDRGGDEEELDPQEFRKFLERVKPSDFGGTVH
ncbi:MAG: bifunctional nuclease family protein [Armatimonadota bacterium]|nr:bifunctional nuclease family protein [Armatimonadota bacterium]MDR7421293.1 bifunctional nuclease family protein [Armatimonadota bacterium]MDR7454074.1 bifunctional nuclease family protein [Armatimonadota bacterium]MDR7455784.1 bifunctional nuclease family protein [Armatimonadota bacterium]MDR7496432.1 bifunctional nuclease family protein [Armatimonadota bacterium]